MLLDERREPAQQPARSAGATARQAGNAARARATAASVSSTLDGRDVGERLGSVAGLRTAVMRGVPRDRRAPRRRAPRTAARPRPLPDARARRRAKRFSGSSTASTVPSSARAASTQPRASLAEALVVVRLHRRLPTEQRPELRAVLDRTACSEKTPFTSRCASCPTTSGRCWPGRRPCDVQHLDAAADRRAPACRVRARLRAARARRGRAAGRVPFVSGCASAPYSLRVEVGATREKSPSSASSVSSTPPSTGGTSSGSRRPARSPARTCTGSAPRRAASTPTAPARHRS